MRDSAAFIRHLIFFVVLLALSIVQLFITFRGLDDQVAMEHAQIAREMARGNGMATKSIAPIAWQKQINTAPPAGMDTVRVGDVHHAPLNPALESVLFRVIGAGDAEKWEMSNDSFVYKLDRVIATLGVILFLLSIGVTYFLLIKVFDAKIASLTAVMMMFCNLMWDFATSGLPMMLMLFCFTVGLFFLYRAIERAQAEEPVFWPVLWSAVFMSLMCLAHWQAVVIFLGYLIYVAVAFRPRGIYGVVAGLVLLLFSGYFMYRNFTLCGNVFGTAWLEAYNGLMGDNVKLMKSLDLSGQAMLDTRSWIVNFFAAVLRQFNNLYAYCGAILAAPVFFLALLHPFRKTSISRFQWAVMLMFGFALLGMTLFGTRTESSANQFLILFAPVMAAYGIAFISIVWNRVELGEAAWARNVPVLAVIVLSALPLLISLPNSIRLGVTAGARGLPNWPPYNPLGLAYVAKQTQPDAVVVSDQPWAVAWYADRTAFWLPMKVGTYDAINEQLQDMNQKIEGILISPSSHFEKPLTEIQAEYDEFAPIVLDEPVRMLSNKGFNLAASDQKLKALMSRYSGPNNRTVMSQGLTSMVLFTEKEQNRAKAANK